MSPHCWSVWLYIQQITRRHCIVSSVLRLCRYKRHKTAVQWAHRLLLIHTGALASCQAATASLTVSVSVGWIHFSTFTYLSSSIIFMADMSNSSPHPCCWFKCSCKMHMRTSIYWSILGCTWISGTRVRQTQGKWYIDTDIPLFHAWGRCHDQCRVCSGSPQLLSYILVFDVCETVSCRE